MLYEALVELLIALFCPTSLHGFDVCKFRFSLFEISSFEMTCSDFQKEVDKKVCVPVTQLQISQNFCWLISILQFYVHTEMLLDLLLIADEAIQNLCTCNIFSFVDNHMKCLDRIQLYF